MKKKKNNIRNFKTFCAKIMHPPTSFKEEKKIWIVKQRMQKC